jgi:hypothetical protein
MLSTAQAAANKRKPQDKGTASFDYFQKKNARYA